MRKIFLSFVCMALLTACSPASNTILLQDHFSGQGAFVAVDEPFGSIEMNDGLLKITANQPGGMMIAPARIDQMDVYAEISGMPQTEGEAVYIGLTCRMQDAANTIYFSVSSSGEAKIVKVTDAVQHVLAQSSSQKVIPVNYGGRINTIAAECFGEQLVLWLNGEQILIANDPNPVSGDLGIFVSSPFAPKTVFFDDLTIAKVNGIPQP